MLLTSFSKHSVLIPRGQSVSAVTGGVEYFREDRQHGYIVMLRARMFRSLIIRTEIKERNIHARNITI